jgi:ABC-type branched-subunit amino acid transport system substrate-binding protein
MAMRTILIRAAAGAALVLATLANSATAQTASPILNAVEVQKLVASADPADNARLSAHFAALAERYAREATRHDAMAQAFIASPTRRTPANTAADHCKRLAGLNTQAANTLRELAAYHQKRAAGAVASVPKGAAPFQAGTGAPEPSDDELSALAARASTPADHHALEEYFQTAAKRYREAVNEHSSMAQAYRGTRIAQAAVHCDRLVSLSRDEAKEATAAAEMHKQLAAAGR